MDEERSAGPDDGGPEALATGAGAGVDDDPDDEGDAFVVGAP
jgi:hypothetical protein